MKRMLRVSFLAVASACALLGLDSWACVDELEIVTGKAAEVIDGDTISFCPKIRGECESDEKYEVDLWGIDAPELLPKKQFHAEKSKEYLESIVDSRVIVIEVMDTDEDGRKSARVFVVNHENSNLNVHLVMEGHAWAAVDDDDEPSEYDLAEKHAREWYLGLWKEVEPVAPWVWREQQEEKKEDEED